METNCNMETANARFPATRMIYIRRCDIDEDYPPAARTHPYTELFYVLEGEGKMRIEDKLIPLRKNDLFIVGSNIKHAEQAVEDKPFKYYAIGIEGLILKKKRQPSLEALNPDAGDAESLTDFLDIYTYLRNFTDEDNMVRPLIDQIYNEVEERKPYFEAFSCCLLRLLILCVLRLSEDEIIVENESETNKQLQYVKDFLDAHYSMDVRLDELATMSYLNKYYLVHEFKKHFGLTPIDYLLRRRIHTAKELLSTSDYTMEEIATIVGFNSQSYFNQVFKKKTQTTPTKYKRTHRK